MKPALVIFAAALLLAGCGHAKTRDAFVGQWVGTGSEVVIGKQAGAYVALEHLGHEPVVRLVYTRRGNHLVAVAEPTGWTRWPAKRSCTVAAVSAPERTPPPPVPPFPQDGEPANGLSWSE